MTIPRFAFVVIPALALVLCPVSFVGTVFAQAQAQGVVEPALSVCQFESHWITDTCTGVTKLIESPVVDLSAFNCQPAQVSGMEIGYVCPTIEVDSIASAPLVCPITEVSGVTADDSGSGTHIAWSRIPCAAKYDVVRGLLGRPIAGGGCLDSTGCLSGSYCDKIPGDCLMIGTCRPRPTGCAAVEDLVCGCNGQTYTNSCVAHQFGVAIACAGSCPCAPVCQAGEACEDIGPVICRINDLPAGASPGFLESEAPRPGEAFFYLVRAIGPGVVGVTTYGYTSDGLERRFLGDCPR